MNSDAVYSSVFSGLRYLLYSKFSFGYFLKCLFSLFFYIKYSSPGDVSFYQSFQIKKRNDLKNMERVFFESLPGDVKFVSYELVFNLWFLLDLILWAKIFVKSKGAGDLINCGVLKKISIFFAGVFYYSTVKRLNLAASKSYVFCDSVGIDAAIAYIYRSKNTYVLCIQHGQYRFDPDICNSDLLPFINACGSGILVWGEVTREEYLRANVANYDVVVAGKFGIVLDHAATPDNFVYLCIVLNGPDSSFVNEGLIFFAIDFSKRYGIEIVLKRHPADYSKYPVDDYCEKRHFSSLFLCYSSGFIVDSLVRRRRFVIFNDGKLPYVYSGLNNIVAEIDELYLYFSSTKLFSWDEFFDLNTRKFVENAKV